MALAARSARHWVTNLDAPQLANAIAALGAAALIRASMPPFDIFPFAFVSWIPLLLLAKRARLRPLLMWSFCHALVLNVVTHWWLVPAVQHAVSAASWKAWGILGVFSAVQGTRTPLVMLLVAIGLRRSLPMWLTFPIATALVERAHPHFFPWTTALQVHNCPIWLQAASLGGLAAVSFWISLVNALLAAAWCNRRNPRVRRVFSAHALAVLGGASLLGYWTQQTRYSAERRAAVGRAVLGHINTCGDRNDPEAVPELRTLTGHALGHQLQVDFVLWPESTIAMPTDIVRLRRLALDYLYQDRLRPTGHLSFNAPLLLGAIVRDAHGLYNSALLTNPTGVLLGRYDKRFLIPIGETSQLGHRLPTPELGVPLANQFTPGAEWTRFVVNGHGILPSICYEDILAGEIRSAVTQTNPELLVNLTSDAWFTGTEAAELHFALAKLRSVEHAKYLIRASRDGVSAVVDSTGSVRYRLARASTRAELVEFRWLPGQTLYAKYGDTWLWLVAGALCAVALRAGFRREPPEPGRAA